jgi:hypothetical protein
LADYVYDRLESVEMAVQGRWLTFGFDPFGFRPARVVFLDAFETAT